MATTTAALPVRATRSFRPIWGWYAVLVAFMVWGLAAWIDELHYGLCRDRHARRRVVGNVHLHLRLLHRSVGGRAHNGLERRGVRHQGAKAALAPRGALGRGVRERWRRS